MSFTTDPAAAFNAVVVSPVVRNVVPARVTAVAAVPMAFCSVSPLNPAKLSPAKSLMVPNTDLSIVPVTPLTFNPAVSNTVLGSAPMANCNPALAKAVPAAALMPNSAARTAPTPGMRKLAPIDSAVIMAGLTSLELMALV